MAQTLDYTTAPIPAIEADLGRRLEAARLAENVTQADLAAEAGVSRRTITRLETGGGVSVETLIRVLRALGLASRLEALVPDPAVRPIDRVRLPGRQRQRARRRSTEASSGEWSWNDRAGRGAAAPAEPSAPAPAAPPARGPRDRTR